MQWIAPIGVDEKILSKAADVKLAVFDVDGVLTDGSLHYGPDGEDIKVFSVLDGHGLKMLQESGVELAIISGRASPALARRAKDLQTCGSNLVFEGQRVGKPLSDMSFVSILRKMGLDATAHGFRSSFRDWASETTSYPGDVCEAALAHKVRDKTEAAYRRGDLLGKRRALMAAWGSYCMGATGNVVRLAVA